MNNIQPLNLIPDYQKAQMRREKIFLLVHNVIGILVVAVAAISIFLLISRSFLANYINNLRAQTNLVNLTSYGLAHDINSLNNKIENADRVQKDFIKWTALLSDISNSVPAGLALNQIYLNRSTQTFRLTGTAASRESLLEFKETLLNHPAVETLETPLSNFLEKTDISFVFGGKLKKDIYSAP